MCTWSTRPPSGSTRPPTSRRASPVSAVVAGLNLRSRSTVASSRLPSGAVTPLARSRPCTSIGPSGPCGNATSRSSNLNASTLRAPWEAPDKSPDTRAVIGPPMIAPSGPGPSHASISTSAFFAPPSMSPPRKTLAPRVTPRTRIPPAEGPKGCPRPSRSVVISKSPDELAARPMVDPVRPLGRLCLPRSIPVALQPTCPVGRSVSVPKPSSATFSGSSRVAIVISSQRRPDAFRVPSTSGVPSERARRSKPRSSLSISPLSKASSTPARSMRPLGEPTPAHCTFALPVRRGAAISLSAATMRPRAEASKLAATAKRGIAPEGKASVPLAESTAISPLSSGSPAIASHGWRSSASAVSSSSKVLAPSRGSFSMRVSTTLSVPSSWGARSLIVSSTRIVLSVASGMPLPKASTRMSARAERTSTGSWSRTTGGGTTSTRSTIVAQSRRRSVGSSGVRSVAAVYTSAMP